MANSGSKMKKILNNEFKKYNSRLAFEIRREIIGNFDAGKDVDGNPFAKLKDSTVSDRISQGIPGKKPILRRTGKLKKSIEVKAMHRNKEIRISSKLKYAKDLNDGTHSGKWGKIRFTPNMKPRKFLETPKALQEGEPKRESIFLKFEKRLISKLEAVIDKVVSKI